MNRNKKYKKRTMRQQSKEDFSNIPTAIICQSIQLLINELYDRGIGIYDFDNKNKYIRQIQIMQNKIYFLSVREEVENGKN